jgi:hypothetical protein
MHDMHTGQGGPQSRAVGKQQQRPTLPAGLLPHPEVPSAWLAHTPAQDTDTTHKPVTTTNSYAYRCNSHAVGALPWWAMPLWSWRTCLHGTYTPTPYGAHNQQVLKMGRHLLIAHADAGLLAQGALQCRQQAPAPFVVW